MVLNLLYEVLILCCYSFSTDRVKVGTPVFNNRRPIAVRCISTIYINIVFVLILSSTHLKLEKKFWTS